MIRKGGKTLGELLKDLRLANGLTLRDVEGLTGISNAYLSQVENSQIKQPSPNFLHKMAGVLNYPYESLMEKAGYVVPRKETGKTKAAKRSEDQQRAFAIFSSVKDLTEEEAEALLEFLNWRRSRKRKPE
jgi:HTH-type transcriptional regulator, competence development regulator